MKVDFLTLVRLGIGTDKSVPVSKSINWKYIQDLAAQQGLSAIVIDGIERLPESLHPPKTILLEWIGEVLQNYEQRYEQYKKAIAEMAGFYNSHDFKMMVLKGYACSLDWPKPEHRPCGDIDIWCFGKSKEADKAVKKELGLIIDEGHHIHTVFNWEGFIVENHYDLINIFSHRQNVELNRILMELAKDDFKIIELYGHKVYMPSVRFNSLFLIEHALAHFAACEINLRQVLDWAFFVKCYSSSVDWEWLIEILQYYHMKDFFDCLNAICIEDLGFERNLFPKATVSPLLKARVLEDIINPAFADNKHVSLLPRLVWKIRRWKGNAWKRNLCYQESQWSSLWYSLKSHLVKPSTI